MPMPDYAASVQAVGLRVSKLTAAGAVLSGAKSAYGTKAFTTFSWTLEYDEGDEINQTNGSGEKCVYYKLDDTVKQVSMGLTICNPQPELVEMLTGGSVLLGPDGSPVYTINNKALTSNVATLTTSVAHALLVGDTVTVTGVDATFNGTYVITAVTSNTFSYAKTAANVTSTTATGSATKTGTSGWAAPAIGVAPTPNGVGVEVWSRAIVAGRPATSYPYWRWVSPFGRWKHDGDRTLENGVLAMGFSGVGFGNLAFNDGPADDWPYPTACDRPFMYARDTAAWSTEGYITVP